MDDVYVENNLVKLLVFFKETSYKDYNESPSYSVSLGGGKGMQQLGIYPFNPRLDAFTV